jgi:hypothetical protein
MRKYVSNGLIGLTILAFISACGLIDPCEDKEISRITSPDSKIDCVLVERNCGATTCYAYSVFLVPKGGTLRKAQPVYRADHISDLNVRWQTAKMLDIRYKEARIFHFTNFWQSGDVNDFRYVVEIREIASSPHALSPKDRWETDVPAQQGRGSQNASP